MSMKKILLASILISAFTSTSYAGFGLETTRVIYSESSKNEGVVAFNTDKNRNYLLQSWIEDINGKVTSDFAVTPPLLKLRAEQKNTLQITKVANINNNQESLYWLNVKFVAPSNENLENVLRYSMTNRIKLIHRPASLTEKDFDKSVVELKWHSIGNNIKVKNTSPFYINIAKLKVNGSEVTAPSYLAPRSDTVIDLPSTIKNPAKVSLSYINDFGKNLESTFSVN